MTPEQQEEVGELVERTGTTILALIDDLVGDEHLIVSAAIGALGFALGVVAFRTGRGDVIDLSARFARATLEGARQCSPAAEEA